MEDKSVKAKRSRKGTCILQSDSSQTPGEANINNMEDADMSHSEKKVDLENFSSFLKTLDLGHGINSISYWSHSERTATMILIDLESSL